MKNPPDVLDAKFEVITGADGYVDPRTWGKRKRTSPSWSERNPGILAAIVIAAAPAIYGLAGWVDRALTPPSGDPSPRPGDSRWTSAARDRAPACAPPGVSASELAFSLDWKSAPTGRAHVSAESRALTSASPSPAPTLFRLSSCYSPVTGVSLTAHDLRGSLNGN